MRLTKPITAVAGLAAVFAAGCLPAESVPVAVLTADPPIVEVPTGFSTSSIIGERYTTITNNGGEDSGPITIETSGNFFAEGCGLLGDDGLDPGESCDIYVYYGSFDQVSAESIDPSTIRDVGYLTVSGENTPAPVVVKLIATEQELQELPL
jgi:hypothetical protein